MKRIHRVVILPSYQGLGLGTLFSSWVGNHFTEKGLRLRITSTHPSIIHQMLKHSNWDFCHKKDHKETYQGDTIRGRFSAGHRSTYTFEYKRFV